MDLQLAGKHALVTGASSGIGAAAAKLLAAEGVAVAVHGRDVERTTVVVDEIRDAGGTAVVAIGDLTDELEAAAVFAAVDAGLGPVDIVFNNAGGRAPGTSPTAAFLDIDPRDWTAAYEINVVSAVRVIRRFAPAMVERGWGRFIQNASAAATSPAPIGNDYAAAKAAVVNLTIGLARALAGTGVTATTVSPGLTLTPLVLEEYLTRYASEHGWDPGLPTDELERLWARHRGLATVGAGRAEQIAAAVVWLASPLADYVDGANVRIDGGHNHNVN
jgi:NAD(P)-dependent dehydrogenase (short-subunit alcohol dehydrogenase family)